MRAVNFLAMVRFAGGHFAVVFLTAAILGVLGVSDARAAEQQAYAAAMSYTTPAISAARGDTLRFTNLDTAGEHDIVSDEADRFASPLLGAGQSALVEGVEKLEPGSYPFHCTLHPWMKGVLTVREAGGGGGGGGEEPTPSGGGGGDDAGEDPPDGSPTPDPMTLAPTAPAEPLGEGAWPVYGHDISNTRDGGQFGPSPQEALSLGPAWSHLSEDGDFTGTPVVSRGLVVMGSRGGTVFALDAATGEAVWERDLLADGEETEARITASAALRGKRVYVPVNAVGKPQIAALDRRTGRVIWRRVIDRQERSDMYGSPQVWKGRVFVGTSGYFGEQVTGVETSARGSVSALSARTGKRLWKTYTVPKGHDGGAVWSTPSIDPEHRRVYIGTGNAYHPPAGPMTDSMIALSIRRGRVVKYFQATANDAWNGVEDSLQSPDADFGSSPNLFTLPDGREVVGQGQKSGVYWVLDRETMEPVWTSLTGPGSFQGGIVGSTAIDGSRVYGTNAITSQVWAVGRQGVPSWTSSDGFSLRYNAVSVANGVVYATDFGGFLTAREAATGVPLAKLSLGAPSWAGVAVAGGSVFTATGSATGSGWIVAYRPR